MAKGTILMGRASFYTVELADGTQRVLRAKGSLRLGGVAPAVGDFVEWEGEMITAILPRESYIARPPIANATLVVVIVSIEKPRISFALTDKMLISAANSGLPSVLVVNKVDLAGQGEEEFL